MVSPRATKPPGGRPHSAVGPRGLPVDATEAQASAITHDVNNLLTAILGHAELALSDDGLSTAASADVVEIVHAARRAALLTRQLVAYRRPDLPERSEIDLRTIVGGTARMLQPLLGDDIELRTVSRSHPILVEASPADLEGIILNLAINARDAMPSGGILTLSTAVRTVVGGRRAVLAVSDTGIGMDAATRSHAFEPYFTTKGPGRGSGLGLASVAATVERCGWALRVESAPGVGSRFSVILPLATRTAIEPLSARVETTA